MQLQAQHVVLTGATGGLGRILALQLAAKGAVVGLVGRDHGKLTQLAQEITQAGGKAHVLLVDFSADHMATSLLKAALAAMGHVDVLINNAGVIEFVAFETQTDAAIANIMHTNVIATLQLSRAFVGYFLQRERGHLVLVGSIFGSLGFPHFATYCASKFAVHGFSQALRRELVDTPIGITYVAPRAIATAMNDDRTNAMWQASDQAVDAPDKVATAIVRALEKEQQECFIGQPQTFFAWLNGFAPTWVNLGLKKQAAIGQRYL